MEQQVDAFDLLERAGDGGGAEVWHARASGSGREVALKIGRADVDGGFLANEARVAQLALSPRLPELVDLGWLRLEARRAVVLPYELADRPSPAGSRPFVALGWVEGQPLVPPSRQADVRLDQVLRAARDVAEGLADLHGVGMAHGDLKPANLLRTPAGSVVLIDLGLAGSAYAQTVTGGTMRYLARHDAELGDARARDLLALGLVLAELASPAVARASEPLPKARTVDLPRPLGTVCRALLAPAPGARPSARWVGEMLRSAVDDRAADEQPSRDARAVRAAYLRLRRHELGQAEAVSGEVAPWLPRAVETARRARAMRVAAGEARTEDAGWASSAVDARVLGPLDAEQRVHWLAALAGSGASSWPAHTLAACTEPELAERLCALAERHPPARWTWRDVEQALDPDAPGVPGWATETTPGARAAARSVPCTKPLQAADAAAIAVRVSRVPLDLEAVEEVERLAPDVPDSLLLAAADALRLAGHLGRARSLVLDSREAAPLMADVLRRSGDWTQATALATRCAKEHLDRDGRARATLALIALERGDLARAAELVEPVDTAAVAEVAARLSARRGASADALALAERGLALPTGAEQRARLHGIAAFAQFAQDPRGARERYRAAVAHAVQAGAVLEEASYRTGEAAACVDLGELEAGIATARRAAVLWDDVLGRPAMAARALLACAAAHACVEARHEAWRAAEQAAARAADGSDARAEAYALWTVADAAPAGTPRAVAAARRADALLTGLRPGHRTGNAPPEPAAIEDRLHGAARLWRHDPEQLDPRRRAELDDAARDGTGTTAHARLAWWGARAERLARHELDQAAQDDARQVLAQLVALGGASSWAAARGKAMYAGCALAEALGDTASWSRLESARDEAARSVVAGCPTWLAEAARSAGWLGRTRTAELHAEQAVDLQRLVRALSARGKLRELLDRVVDVLLLWTGAERGLLLLRDGAGELVPRSARNLQRDDLAGEQLTVSRSLAERALESGEPVVAFDAMQELSQSHRSVHALKLRSVMTVPLIVRDEVLGVVYLDDRVRRGAFGPKELRWAQSVAPVAALAIDDATTQDQLRQAVRRAERESRRLARTLAHKETALDAAERELAVAVGGRSTRFRYDEIIGESVQMQKMLHLLDRISVADVPVLLRGESGSGKELCARAIHRHSPRAERPFVGENCAALPEPLLESTLFGHVRGAFTGALRSRVGLFEAADGGTLFLDEIGEMSLAMQTKLLRVIEDGQVRPVGSERDRQVDVRIVAATHRDLELMVQEGTFREDLYYRLNVVQVAIPPLRERPDDIPLLVGHLLSKHAAGGDARVSPAAMKALASFPWPGNVRQLENELRRALLLADGPIDVSHLSIPQGSPEPAAELGLNIRARLDQLERKLVEEALDQTGGNQTRAAKLLGVSRYGLHKMIKRLGIRTERPRTS